MAERVASAEVGSGAYVESPEVPFVGREAELARLDHFLTEALEGHGQVCFISGEAGSGKTALATEFLRRAQAQHRDLQATWGAGNAQTGIGDPYLPFREALATLTDGSSRHPRAPGEEGETKVARTALARTAQILIDVAPDLVGLFVPGAKIAGALGKALASKLGWMDRLDEMAGKHTESAPEQQRIFEQYTAFIQKLSEREPVLLFLDDLQWADAASLELLFYLVRHIASSRVMIIGAYRPSDVALGRAGGRHPLEPVLHELMRYYGDIVIDLAKAQETSGRQFVDGIIDSQPNAFSEDFRSDIYRLTDGHALFTIELLRMLQIRGDLFQDDQGRWSSKHELDLTHLPARIEGVIEERVRRLEEGLHTVLTAASVQGLEFDAEVVASVEDVSRRHLIRQLGNELTRQHRLVEALGMRHLGSRQLSQYRFVHSLFQQYLYNELDEIERSMLHEDIGRALENLIPAEAVPVLAGRLAYHFQAAGNVHKAIPYRLLAAQHAARLSAYQEAVNHLSEGLALLEPLDGEEVLEGAVGGSVAPQIVDVPMVGDVPTRDAYEMAFQTALGDALAATKGWAATEAQQAYARAYRLGRALGKPPEIAHTLYGLASVHEYRGEYKQAETLIREHLQLPIVEQDYRQAAASHELLSCSTFHQGLFDASLEHANAGLDLYATDKPGTVAPIAVENLGVACHAWGAMNLWFLGYPDQAVARVGMAIHLAQRSQHPYTFAKALDQAASVHHVRREPELTIERAAMAMSLATRHQLAYYIAYGRILHGWAMAALGQADGIDEVLSGVAAYRKTGIEMDRPYFLGLLAETYIVQGQSDRALPLVLEALSLVEHGRSFFYQTELLRLKGILLLSPGPNHDAAAGEAGLREAIALARHQKALSLELRATMSLVPVTLARGDRTVLSDLKRLYAQFGEGLDTADLVEARDILSANAA